MEAAALDLWVWKGSMHWKRGVSGHGWSDGLLFATMIPLCIETHNDLSVRFTKSSLK